MADMRLIVAGAGGRMGRTLVKAIAETKGLALAGAVEDARSPLIGQDAGVLAGLPANGIKLATDAKALLASADGIIDFTVPKASVAFAALTAGKVHIVGTTGHSADEEAACSRDAGCAGRKSNPGRAWLAQNAGGNSPGLVATLLQVGSARMAVAGCGCRAAHKYRNLHRVIAGAGALRPRNRDRSGWAGAPGPERGGGFSHDLPEQRRVAGRPLRQCVVVLQSSWLL